MRRRGNIGQAVIYGAEAYAEADLFGLLHGAQTSWSIVLFNNVAFIKSKYRKSEEPGVTGNSVEFVPDLNLKNGVRVGYKNFKTSLQLTHLSQQYADATNAPEGGVSAVVGIIPSYTILDFGASYAFKKLRLEANVNNLADKMYFTRRATGYPGPGILPSDGRSFYVTLQVKI
jgi:Fe(3+) dicitrate transport protein